MVRKSVKLSVSIDPTLHARLSAYCSLKGTTRSAVLAEALTVHLRGLVLFNREKKSARGDSTDRLEPVRDVNPEGEIAAA